MSGSWRSTGDVVPEDGSSMFFAGAGAGPFELYQEVDISGFASTIDNGTQEFALSAYMADDTGDDESQIVIEYLDGSKSLISSFNSPIITSISWTNYTDIRTAPANTRYYKIRLIATRNVGTDNDGYFDDITLIDGDSPLPINLVEFYAKKNEDKTVTIYWQTATEINNDFFTVDKSIDSKLWNKLVTIKGAGNSNRLLDYSVVDNKPFEKTYYRLKQTDFDGKFAYSEIVFIDILEDDSFKIMIYPNPSKNQIIILGNKREISDVHIVNMMGQNIDKDVVIVKKQGVVKINLSKLSSGIYFIKTLSQTNKIIKE